MMLRRLSLLLVGLTLVCAPFVVRADSTTTEGKSIVEQIGCDVTSYDADGKITITNPCDITDFINLFVYLSKWGMSVLAFLSTGMLIYGGFQFVTAGGRPSKVDEGKRAINGTIIGTIIALTAYIIINTTFAAISGNKITSYNPFGVITTVFSEKRTEVIQGQTVSLTRPFSGSGSSSGSGSQTPSLNECRTSTDWNHACSIDQTQIGCADPATGEAPIAAIQAVLESRGYSCGGSTGCYNADTVKCIRDFQLANSLPPTGVVNRSTKDKIDNGGIGPTAASTATAAKLPGTENSTATGSTVGCCIVRSGNDDVYCVDSITTPACQALGSGNVFTAGKCGIASGTASRCGFCSNVAAPTASSGKCTPFATPFWCANMQGSTTPTFVSGSSSCSGRCQSCANTLQSSFQ